MKVPVLGIPWQIVIICCTFWLGPRKRAIDIRPESLGVQVILNGWPAGTSWAKAGVIVGLPDGELL
jgi:hypothetical protein